MKVELHPSAEEELVAQIGYYEAQEPGLGQRFYHEVISTLKWIGENPGVARPQEGRRHVKLSVFPFHVVFSVETERIWVLALAHTSRRPGYWRKRVKGG